MNGINLFTVARDTDKQQVFPQRRKRSFSWTSGQRPEDEVLKRSEKLLQTLNRRSAELSKATNQLKSSIEEIQRNASQYLRRRPSLNVVDEAEADSSTEDDVWIEEEDGSKPQLPPSYSPDSSLGNLGLESTLTSSQETSLSSPNASLFSQPDAEKDVDQSPVEATDRPPSSEMLTSVTSLPAIVADSQAPKLKDSYCVMCEQETNQSSCGLSGQMVIGIGQRFGFHGSKEELVAFPSSKTYTDLSTSLSDESHLRV